jgi:hypothetical protein
MRAGFLGSFPTESSQPEFLWKRFELDFCTSDAQYRLASKVGKGRAHRVSGERVFIEREFAEIGQDSLSSEKFLVGEKQEVRAKLLGKHGWGISEIF